jgi:hypothetical protein
MNNLLTEIIVSFIIGGSIMASITYLVKYLEPAIGALVWAAPIILLPSVFLLWFHNVSNENIGLYIYTSIPYFLLTMLWQVTFVLLLKKTKYLNDKNGVIKASIISLIVWTIFAFIFYYSKFHKLIKIK